MKNVIIGCIVVFAIGFPIYLHGGASLQLYSSLIIPSLSSSQSLELSDLIKPLSSKGTENSFGQFKVIYQEIDNDPSSALTSIYIQSKVNYALYLSAFIASLGVFLNGLILFLGREDRDKEHKKNILDEFWFRVILLPELRSKTNKFVKITHKFLRNLKSVKKLSTSNIFSFIENDFNRHYHDLLMIVEVIKLVDPDLEHTNKSEDIFEKIEDMVVDLASKINTLSFHEMRVCNKSIVDSLNADSSTHLIFELFAQTKI